MAARQKNHIQNDVAFQLQTTPFCCVLGTRLIQDDNSGICRAVVAGFLLWSFRRCGALVGKAASLHRSAAFAAALRRHGRTVSETCAGHRSADALVAARSVPVTR